MAIIGFHVNLIIIVIRATMIVAIRTPLALGSLLVFINKKKAPKFKSAPILTSFVSTPCEIAVSSEFRIESPVPNNNNDKVRPTALAIMPIIIPIIISLFFKCPSI